MIGRYDLVKESSSDWMNQLLYAENAGIVGDLYNYGKNISNVKLEDVKKMARNAADKYSFFALIPQN